MGDRNARFFHTSTSIHRQRNTIRGLKNEDGVWIWDLKDLEKLAIQYFTNLFSEEPHSHTFIPNAFPRWEPTDMSMLTKEFTPLEIKEAVHQMRAYKALGPDGFQPFFYHHCWETVGEKFCEDILNCLHNAKIPPKMNETLLVLIPKNENPKNFRQFRPISLCNVAYKTITKVIVNCLKPLLTNS